MFLTLPEDGRTPAPARLMTAVASGASPSSTNGWKVAIAGTFPLHIGTMATIKSLRNSLAGVLLASASIGYAQSEALKDWQNPRLTGLNNLAPHATMVICPDAKTALKIGPVANAERVKSPFYRSLNGQWKYHYSKNHSGRVPDFWKPGFNDHSWPTIPVPSNVEMRRLRRSDLREHPVSVAQTLAAAVRAGG